MSHEITSSEVLIYVDKVASDSTLPTIERSRVRRLQRYAADPALAYKRLEDQARAFLPTLPREQASDDLCRGVSAATLRAHIVRAEVQAAFSSGEDLARYVDAQSDPAAALRELMPASGTIVFPWSHSWLAPSNALRGVTGSEFAAMLEVGIQAPFAVFHLSVDDMRAHGVLVRTPCSLDSVLGRNSQWRAGGPLSGVPEFVDGDIPIDAVTSIEWRR